MVKIVSLLRRRMNALANRKSEYLESLLLENFQDEWEVDPKDLSYNMEDTLGQGSFGLVCRGRLARLTTPAAEYLHLSPSSTSGESAFGGGVGDGGRLLSTLSPTVDGPMSGVGGKRSRRWFQRRSASTSTEVQGIDVAVKVRHSAESITVLVIHKIACIFYYH